MRYNALKAAGKQNNVPIVAIDGSCDGLNDLLKQREFAADATQYPGKMASLGVDGDRRPRPRRAASPRLPAGKDFFDTGTAS